MGPLCDVIGGADALLSGDGMTQKHNTLLKWNSHRYFGVELEMNGGERTRRGICDAVNGAVRGAGHRAEVRPYEKTVGDPRLWVCKPDSSCGSEVASPPLAGPGGVAMLGDVVEALTAAGAQIDERCGMHVHVDARDFTDGQIASTLCWWIKAEHSLMNAHPPHRWRDNRYCRPLWEMVDRLNPAAPVDEGVTRGVRRVVSMTRGSVNLQNWETRRTVEFRSGDMSLRREDVENRVRLLVWFMDLCARLGAPPTLEWFSPMEMIRFLGLAPADGKILSAEMRAMRRWLVFRMARFTDEASFGTDMLQVRKMMMEVADDDLRARAPLAS
jgi:hypothetical protein